MKKDIHPQYNVISVECSCGHTFETRSTLSGNLKIDICSKCHPFFTGKQKIVDTGGRVNKFKERFSGTLRTSKKAAN